MYDYVIVGAGSAGCVLAARLSEDPDVRVCVLEAGPPDVHDNIHVPAAFGKLFKTQHDWDYSTVREPFADERRIYLPRGRTLGGSSSMNAMIYIRGHRADYDEWEALGAEGWGFDDLLPYFKRAEDNERGASEWHGAGGPLTVSESRSNNVMTRAFVEAAVAAGLPRNDDFNGPEQEGVGIYQLTQRGGRRCSAAVAYLHPAMERPNLTVLPYAQAHRVLFDGTRAVGVEYGRFGEVHEARAEREVLVCGGAYNSPQLLMLSGIGPAEALAIREIEVLLDQPLVGANLQDHPNAGAIWTCSDQPVSLLVGLTPEALTEFAEHGTGPLTSNVGEGGGFARVRPGSTAPDIQYHAAPVMFAEEGLADPTDHGFTLGVCVLKPASRGTVSLMSNEPTAKPVIRHNYFEAEEDMATMVAGLRQALDICAQEPLRPYTDCEHMHPASDSDEDLRAHVRHKMQTLYHPTSTCAIGDVVDTQLRVLGAEALRVIDASVMPTVPRGNTNAPTIAIAERAADLIRGTAPLAAEPAAATA